MNEAGVETSVGSKGDSYYNALAESINGLYKAEMFHRRAPWKTKESVETATLESVFWSNTGYGVLRIATSAFGGNSRIKAAISGPR